MFKMMILTVEMPFSWDLKTKEMIVDMITEVRGAAADTQKSLGLIVL